VPFQNKPILSPAPYGSLAFAAQGMSQSAAVAFVVPGVMVSARKSVQPKAKARWILKKNMSHAVEGKAILTAFSAL
jgi:hypothetical protein